MSWWQYLLLVNLYLVLFFVFFSLLLRRETFFQLNRVYMVASGLLSLLIPLIQADWVKDLFITQKVKYILYNHPIVIYNFKPSVEQQQVTIGLMLLTAYLLVVLILAIRLAWQLIQLHRIINQPATPSAYSFFKAVRLSDDLNGREVIMAHEQVHARQWHSIDVLLIEFLAIINWFNPVVYFYRRAIKHIHEFIADKQAVSNGIDKSEYALLLLSQTFNLPAHQLVNPFFNHSLLKQRITMLQKRKSNRVALVKYGLSAPLFILMLILSSATINNSNAFRIINRNAEQVFLTPASDALSTDSLTDSVKFDPAEPRNELTRKQAAGVAVGDITIDKIGVTTADTIPTKIKEKVFTAVDQSPDFPGGIEEFYRFLGKTVHYPKEMRENNIQGRVIITFVVEKDGSLSHAVVLRSPAKGLADESLRVIALSPKWNPGLQSGKPVRVQFTVPISFTLSEDNQIRKKDTTQKSGALNPSTILKITGVTMPTGDTSKQRFLAGSKLDITNGRTYHTPINGSSSGLSSSFYLTTKDNLEPMFILDGKETERSGLANLNSKEIESISVLKDKSATSIYGYKGANGVIVITTKRPPITPPKEQ